MSVAPNCFTSDIASGYISDPLIRSKGIIAKTFFFVLLKVSKFSTETSWAILLPNKEAAILPFFDFARSPFFFVNLFAYAFYYDTNLQNSALL